MFGVFWKYDSPQGPRVVTCHTGSFSKTDAEAKEEGRNQLSDLKGVAIMPLVVVETTQEQRDEIVNECPELELGENEQLFYDVSETPYWRRQKWWPL